MRIETKQPLPNSEQLIELLRQDFSSRYSYNLFGIGGKKTILIESSPFVGAQVSIGDNDLNIQATPPSIAVGNFLFVFSWIGVDVILGLLYRSQLKNMELAVAKFLKERFG